MLVWAGVEQKRKLVVNGRGSKKKVFCGGLCKDACYIDYGAVRALAASLAGFGDVTHSLMLFLETFRMSDVASIDK
jgi:hypothetical protein